MGHLETIAKKEADKKAALEEIQNAVAKGELAFAIQKASENADLLFEFAESKKTDLGMILARLISLNRDNGRGILSRDQFTLNSNQIIHAFLSLVGMKDVSMPSQMPTQNVPTSATGVTFSQLQTVFKSLRGLDGRIDYFQLLEEVGKLF